jgi:hypothetical protein
MMLRISIDSLSIGYGVVVLFLALLVPTGCKSDMRLDYHIIEPGQDAIPQVAATCRAEEQGLFAYRFPDGNMVELTASLSAAFSVAIGSGVDIRLTKAPPAGEGGVEIVNVTVVAPLPDIANAAKHRRRLEWCDLLVIAGGKPVGVVYSGTGQWESSLPGGTFDSYEAAESIYSAFVGNLDRVALSRAAVERDAELSKWLVLRDAWEFHCHPETKAEIRSKDPAAYEKLMALPSPNCKQQPLPPK